MSSDPYENCQVKITFENNFHTKFYVCKKQNSKQGRNCIFIDRLYESVRDKEYALGYIENYVKYSLRSVNG